MFTKNEGANFFEILRENAILRFILGLKNFTLCKTMQFSYSAHTYSGVTSI